MSQKSKSDISIQEEKKPETESKSGKNAHFNEDNLLETYHPENKDYGYDTIAEPKTPFIRSRNENEGVNPNILALKLEALKKQIENEEKLEESEEETQEAQVKINLIEDAKDEEEEKRKKEFERRRRLFYAKEYKPNKSEEKANDNDKADDENKNKTQNDVSSNK